MTCSSFSSKTANNKTKDDEFESSSIYDELSLPITIWIDLSGIAVPVILCSLMWMASLLAAELDRQTDHLDIIETDSNDDDEPSLELEKWLRQFELFNNFVEEINSYFGNILAFIMFETFLSTSHSLFLLVRKYDIRGVSLNISLGLTSPLKDFEEKCKKYKKYIYTNLRSEYLSNILPVLILKDVKQLLVRK